MHHDAGDEIIGQHQLRLGAAHHAGDLGIGSVADFGGDAVRSLATSETLHHIEEELRKDVTLSRAADLTEQAARIMLSDLDEWRLVNQQRDLSVG